MDINTSGSVYDQNVGTPHEQNLPGPATVSSHTGAGSLYNGMKTDKISPDSQLAPYQTPSRAENTKGLPDRKQESLNHQPAFTININNKILNSTPEFEAKVSHLGQRVSIHAEKKMHMVSATFVDEHENAEHKRQTSLITEKGEEPASPKTSQRAAELGKVASQFMPEVSSAILYDSEWVPAQSDGWAAIAKHEKNIQEYQKVLREAQSTARKSSSSASPAVSRDISSPSLDPRIVSAERTSDIYSALLNTVKSQFNINDVRTSLHQALTVRTQDQSSQQGRATDETSTVDTGLETQTSELEIIEQTRPETREELTVQGDSAVDVQVSEVKTKDYRSICSSILKDLPSDSSARESDTSAAEKATTAAAVSTPASPLATREDLRVISDEPPAATGATGHHDVELFTGKPPLKGPEKSLLSGDDQAVDEVGVETRESLSESQSISYEQVRSRLASETDKSATGKLSPEATVTGDELPEPGQMVTTSTVTEPAVTPHDLAPTPDDKQCPAPPPPSPSPSLPLTDETVTTETLLRTTAEIVGETTVEDSVEEIRHDQYRTPSPLGSHPSQQGGVPGDTSTVHTDLETQTTELEITEQTRSEAREELTIQDDSVVSRLKEPDGRSADKVTTELTPSTGGVSEKLDPEYDHSLIRSDSAHLPEEQEPLSIESQPSVVTTGASSESDSDDMASDSDEGSVKRFGDRKDESTLHMTLDGYSKDKSELSDKDDDLSRLPQASSHSRTSSDGKPDAGSPIINPDLTVAGPLFTSEQSDHEDTDPASEGEGKEGWRTPPEALSPTASTRPPESLSRVINQDDTRKQGPEVLAEKRQSTAPATTRQLASQEDSNILTDIPSATDETVGTDTTETQPLTTEQKRSASDEQVITVEEAVDDEVDEKIRHNQYRTSSLGSQPSQQGGVSGDSSTIDSGLVTQTTGWKIIEQTRSETREELTVKGDSAVDVKASEVKTKDDQSISSSVLKDLASGRSARESDTSAAERLTTTEAYSMGRTSEQRDPQYDQGLTGSDPFHLSEGYATRSEDRQSLGISAESPETHRIMSPEASSIELSKRQTSLEGNDLLNEYQKVAKQSVGELVDNATENIQHLSEEDESDRLSPVTGSSNNTRLSPIGMISSLTETGLRSETEEEMHRMSESMREQVTSEGVRNLKSQDSMVESSKPESLSTASDVPGPVATTYGLLSDIDKQQSHTVRYTMTHTIKTTKEKTDEFTTTDTQRETTTDKEGLDNQSVQYDSNPDLSVKEKITDLDITPGTSEYVRQRIGSSPSPSSSEEGYYHIQQDPVDTESGQSKLENVQEFLHEELQQSGSAATNGDDSDHFSEVVSGYSEGDLGAMKGGLRAQKLAPSSMDSSLSLPAEADQDSMTQTIMHRTERKVDELEVRGADREDSVETTIDGKPQEAVTQQGKMSLFQTVSASTMELQQSSATLDPADGVHSEQSVFSEQAGVRSRFSMHRTVKTEYSQAFHSSVKTQAREVPPEAGAELSQTVSEGPKTLATDPSTERYERFLTETKQQVSSDHRASQKAASGEASGNTQPLDQLAEELVDKVLHNVLSEKEFQQTSTHEKPESPAAEDIEHVEPRITEMTGQLRGLRFASDELMKSETTEPQETELAAGDIAETITSKEKDIDQYLEKMVAELVSEDSDNAQSDELERHKSSIATGSSSNVELPIAGAISDLDESEPHPMTDEEMERLSSSMRKEHLESKRTTTTTSVYMTRTESHKTEVKASVAPGRAPEKQVPKETQMPMTIVRHPHP